MRGEERGLETEGTIIYVAGNPDLYPAEYYDAQSGTYQGAIPIFSGPSPRSMATTCATSAPGEEDLRRSWRKTSRWT